MHVVAPTSNYYGLEWAATVKELEGGQLAV